MTKALLAAALIGHLLCFVCDLLLTYSPDGKFNFKVLNDNEKMSVIFEKNATKKFSYFNAVGSFGSYDVFMRLFGAWRIDRAGYEVMEK